MITTVNGSMARAWSICPSTAEPPVGIPGCARTFQENTTSSAEKGVPSCHLTLGLRFHVVSIRPSGRTTMVPSSKEGNRAASRPSTFPWASVDTSPFVWISKSDRAPPPVVPMSHGEKPLTEFRATTVSVFRNSPAVAPWLDAWGADGVGATSAHAVIQRSTRHDIPRTRTAIEARSTPALDTAVRPDTAQYTATFCEKRRAMASRGPPIMTIRQRP